MALMLYNKILPKNTHESKATQPVFILQSVIIMIWSLEVPSNAWTKDSNVYECALNFLAHSALRNPFVLELQSYIFHIC